MTVRLAFLGVGWIGENRLRALTASGAAEAVLVADADAGVAERVAAEHGAEVVDPEAVWARAGELDGLVIATPSALHAAQAIAALDAGLAVFCQKPLARTAAETATVVEAARRADRLVGVDLSYRHLEGVAAMRRVLDGGDIGRVYAADLVFHNAYGPDKAWFRDRSLSGGGCVIDLGIHLVDLALWLLAWPEVSQVTSTLFHGGRPLRDGDEVEDHAVAELHLADGGLVRLACSWNLPAGRDAVIGASFYGTTGAVELGNVGGSFYDFVAHHHRGTATEVLAGPPDDWGGRAALDWARRLAASPAFDPSIDEAVAVAGVLDRVYGR